MYQCICCEKEIKSWGINPPEDLYNEVFSPLATYFESTGNYGSGVFDPTNDLDSLVIYVCDDCLKKKSHLVKLVMSVKSTNIIRCDPFSKCLKEEEISNESSACSEP